MTREIGFAVVAGVVTALILGVIFVLYQNPLLEIYLADVVLC